MRALTMVEHACFLCVYVAVHLSTLLPPFFTMRVLSVLLLLSLALLSYVALSSALSPPPVFEHKMEKNYDKTRCEVCQAVIKQALRKIPVGAPDLSTQKMRRKREQKVGRR